MKTENDYQVLKILEKIIEVLDMEMWPGEPEVLFDDGSWGIEVTEGSVFPSWVLSIHLCDYDCNGSYLDLECNLCVDGGIVFEADSLKELEYMIKDDIIEEEIGKESKLLEVCRSCCNIKKRQITK